jgi:hypothetical protein
MTTHRQIIRSTGRAPAGVKTQSTQLAAARYTAQLFPQLHNAPEDYRANAAWCGPRFLIC